MLSLCLSEWLGWKCKHNEWVFCTVLLRVSGLLLCGSSCLGRISLGWSVKKKDFNRGVKVVHEILHGLELFGSPQADNEDVNL